MQARWKERPDFNDGVDVFPPRLADFFESGRDEINQMFRAGFVAKTPPEEFANIINQKFKEVLHGTRFKIVVARTITKEDMNEEKVWMRAYELVTEDEEPSLFSSNYDGFEAVELTMNNSGNAPQLVAND